MSTAPTPRMPPLPVAEWTDEQRALLSGNMPRADRYLTGAPDAPPMPSILGLFARHARVGGPWLAFSGLLLDCGVLGARERELLILRASHRVGCRYQWDQHVRIAEGVGLTPGEVAAAATGPDAPAWADGDRDLLRAVDQLVDRHVVDDATWERLAARFDERELLELLFVVGSYVGLAMVLNSVGLDAEAELPSKGEAEAGAGAGAGARADARPMCPPGTDSPPDARPTRPPATDSPPDPPAPPATPHPVPGSRPVRPSHR
ncbi:carboxymuconolactone decarboxylase family protein [Yinghuangia sp. ASG 101]|uniref:carboxymuconolactone decarboxylase family protein n=1 Tax=Yinghuangia sp. ASG 101 TaxID=2896848 RepID=UPI001E44DC9C|nr:carboxymuconolactone decarboxylase family protein [Yinghuangia sp. ASG 101]UGQ12571.1 carboxymuconolactone decarboxylase family protein [Yinghuangia sp. ASG 101]